MTIETGPKEQDGIGVSLLAWLKQLMNGRRFPSYEFLYAYSCLLELKEVEEKPHQGSVTKA